MGVSEGHRQITAAEYAALDATPGELWHLPATAAQQRALADEELERLRVGEVIPVFQVLQQLVALVDPSPASVLEVGCASGYYSEVLRLGGWHGSYHGVDYSATLIELAKRCHPRETFSVADATDLGTIGQFDLVITGACLMHVLNWRDALAELVRVTRGPVILHRTPLAADGQTSYWHKSAYGAPCLEMHFGEAEFLAALHAAGLAVTAQRDVGVSDTFTMRSYLCQTEVVR
jgi:SAM-dependent methyltransferase